MSADARRAQSAKHAAGVKKDQAARLLSHYIGKLMDHAGLVVDSDTHAELRECVDCIVDAAVLQVAAGGAR